MTYSELQVLLLLDQPLSCTEVGERLWSKGKRKPQSYARPAGKILRKLLKKGFVEHVLQESRAPAYCLSRSGRAILEILPY